jgi:hypothetical protein
MPSWLYDNLYQRMLGEQDFHALRVASLTRLGIRSIDGGGYSARGIECFWIMGIHNTVCNTVSGPLFQCGSEDS